MKKGFKVNKVLMFLMLVSLSCLSFAFFSFNNKNQSVADAVYTEGSAIYVGVNTTVELGADLVISGNTGSTYGGAVYVAGTLNISGAKIQNCSATNGGAIYVASTGTVNMSSGEISGCSSTSGFGAAIYNVNGTVNISGGTISGNSVQSCGGAIYTEFGTLTISGGTFSNNSAERGGAVYVEGGAATITGGTFNDNSADIAGGAIEAYGCAFSMNGTSSKRITFSGNTVENPDDEYAGGGAICLYDEEYNPSCSGISYCDFIENTTPSCGGAVYFAFPGAFAYNFTNCTFTSNIASDKGGAIGVSSDGSSGSSIVFEDCAFEENQAQNGGGAIFNWGSPSVFINSGTTFDTCATLGDGGAIYTSGSPLIINAGEFNNCQADCNGGAIFADGFLEITGADDTTYFTDCKADLGGNDALGGAIYAVDCSSNLGIRDVSITSCSSYFGGAIAISGDNDGAITGVTINGCEQYENGAIWLNGCDIDMDNISITDCVTSDGFAGGIYIAGAQVNFYGGINISNCQGLYGGGIYLDGSASLFVSDYGGGSQSISNCNADSGDGGGIYVSGSAELRLDQQANLTISNCNSRGNGGGIYYAARSKSTSMLAYDTTITGCFSGQQCYGGGIYVGDYLTLECIYLEVYDCGNQYVIGGGIYLEMDSNINLSYCEIYSNTSKAGIGANITVFAQSVINISNTSIYSPITGYNIYMYDRTELYIEEGSTIGSSNPSSNDRIYSSEDGIDNYIEYYGGTLYSIIDNEAGSNLFCFNPENKITIVLGTEINYEDIGNIEISDFRSGTSGYAPTVDGTTVYLTQSAVTVHFYNNTDDRLSITFEDSTVKSVDANDTDSFSFLPQRIICTVYNQNCYGYVEVDSDQLGGVIETLTTTSTAATNYLSCNIDITCEDIIRFTLVNYSTSNYYSVDVQVLDASGNESTLTGWDITSSISSTSFEDAHTFTNLKRVYDVTINMGLLGYVVSTGVTGITTYTVYNYKIFLDGELIDSGNNSTTSYVTKTVSVRVHKTCVIGVQMSVVVSAMPPTGLFIAEDWNISIDDNYEQDILIKNAVYSTTSYTSDDEKYVVKANRLKKPI